jgi:ABC-type branched-subunit amino acid transport system substrate-binding protein
MLPKRLILSSILCVLSSNAAVADPSPFKIGVILPLTGEVAQFGAKLREGIERSSHSGVEFVFEDDACQSAKALSAYRKLSTLDGVRYFLGPCCGGIQVVAPELAHGSQLSFATCPVSEEAFIQSNGRILTPQYSIQEEGSFNARRIYELGYKKVLILLQETEFGRLNERAFSASFAGKVVATLSYNGFDVHQLRSVLLKLKQLEFDAVYMPHMEPLLLGALKEMRRVGISDKAAFSIFSAQVPEVLSVNGDAAEGLRYSYPDIPLNEDAVSYFPKLAAEMLSDAITVCAGDYVCVEKHLREKHTFSKMGTLKRKIVLRTVHNGRFALEQIQDN